MTRLSIIAVGKLPAEYLGAADHFMRMLSKDLIINEIIIKKNITGPEIMEIEADSILSKIHPSDYVVLLDPIGKKHDSISFANFLSRTMSNSKISFIIGGAWGVSSRVKSRSNASCSLSDFTFSHMLARIILLEQIYRAKSIIAGHPYHK
jgi:23S rRNA (pseudouridine1915-N3)-methyltransferase